MMSLPIGTVIAFAGSADSLDGLENDGWFVCDGRQLQTGDYPDLHGVIGDQYGSGPDYFNLPQLSGMFLRGIDPNGKVDPDTASRTSPDPSSTKTAGPIVGSRQSHQLLNHVHNWDGNFGTISDRGDELDIQLAASNKTDPGSGDRGTQATTNRDGGGNETRPSNVYVYYLIYAGSPSN
jgi:Phage Tail Collar Domain